MRKSGAWTVMVELEMVKHSQIWDLFWSRELRIANSLDVTRNREIIFFLA